MESLFEQMATISKAHAYDTMVSLVIDLKQIIRELIDKGDLEDLVFLNPEDTAKFKKVLNRAKILSL